MHDGKRRATAALGAVFIVAAIALLTTAVLGAVDGSDGRQSVGLGPVDDTTTTTDRTPRSRRATSTTAGPEVLAEETRREPDGSTTTTVDTAPATTASTGAPTPTTAPTPRPTAPPPTAPTTTTCRDSADPACGSLVWDPAPAPDDVGVEEESVPRSAVVGEPVTFSVRYEERAGADAPGACASWAATGPGVRGEDVSTCEAENHSCPRYGPHTPPAPSTDKVEVARTIVFTTPGEHEVTVGGHTATHLADGCANPYLSTWSRTYVVEVAAA